MARVTTLKDRVKTIISKYKRVNDKRFVYNKPGDLKRKYTAVKIWFLIHDADKGYSVMPFVFKRTAELTVKQWTTLLTSGLHIESRAPTPDFLEPLIEIFRQAVLPAINNKGGNSWRFKALLAWTGHALQFQDKAQRMHSRFAAPDNEIHPSKDSAAHRTGNKNAKKRNAGTHSSNRRGQRNKTR